MHSSSSPAPHAIAPRTRKQTRRSSKYRPAAANPSDERQTPTDSPGPPSLLTPKRSTPSPKSNQIQKLTLQVASRTSHGPTPDNRQPSRRDTIAQSAASRSHPTAERSTSPPKKQETK